MPGLSRAPAECSGWMETDKPASGFLKWRVFPPGTMAQTLGTRERRLVCPVGGGREASESGLRLPERWALGPLARDLGVPLHRPLPWPCLTLLLAWAKGTEPCLGPRARQGQGWVGVAGRPGQGHRVRGFHVEREPHRVRPALRGGCCPSHQPQGSEGNLVLLAPQHLR